jgi:DNA polymerase I
MELRTMTHWSGELSLIRAFEQGQDVHATTAMGLFGKKSTAEVEPEERRIGKAVNFGVA